MNLINNKLTSIYPLSYSQKSVFFLEKLTNQKQELNQYIALKILSPVNSDDIKKTFEKIVDFHPILKTKYGSNLETHHQNFTQIEVKDLGETELKERVYNIINTPFDLEKEAPFRVTLLTCQEKEHILIISTHYIAFDPQSWEILLKDFQTIYHQITTHQEVCLARENTRQYFDFIPWQQEFLTTETAKDIAQYWHHKFQGEIPILNLPFDQSLASVSRNQQKVITVIYHEELYQGIKNSVEDLTEELYFNHNINFEEKLEIFLLITLEIFLYRYTGQEEMIIASLTNLKTNHQEFKNTIGNFLNQFVIKNSILKEYSFKDLLLAVNDEISNIGDQKDYPFELLVEKIVKQRDLSRPPLGEVLLDLPLKNIDPDIQNLLWPYATIKQFNWQGLIVERFDEFRECKTIHNLDLHLEIFPTTDSLIINWHYNAELFHDSTIQRMIANFQVLLEGILNKPEEKIGLLPILTTTEKHQILNQWNALETEQSTIKLIHQLFEDQVIKNPHHIAVSFAGENLTYEELNQKANQLAHYLRKLGVKPDSIVAFCLERSLEMIIAFMGILKAGGAYVPIDINYPPERISYMLENSQAPILLTQKSLQDKFQSYTGNLIYLDQDWAKISQENSENPVNHTSLENLIYVIYTSGSTGTPKGVLLNHYTIANLIQWQLKHSTASPQAKTLQYSPISFDVSCQEISFTLSNGGTLVLISEEQRKDFNTLTDLLETEEIERLFMPFVALQIFTETANLKQKKLPKLKEIITAGEQLKLSSSIRQFFKRLDHCTLHNQYGPSESHVVTALTLPKGLENCSYLAPIGYGIDNSKIYILDPYLKPVPMGVTGEIYLGGNVIARGYLHREDLTQERFINNPFAEGKLYKTGDLAKYFSDGNIQYIGRIDNQVKIRGFRIELGEIEGVFHQYDLIQETVVIVHENQKGNKTIVAYYIPKNKQRIDLAQLKSFLKQKLPEYMMPSIFIPLDKFPLSPNGKVDRKALPNPENYRQELTEDFIKPQTKFESEIAQIWQELLQLDSVSITDNFFDLGGHSLLVVRVINQLKEKLNIDLPITKLFEYPTIKDLAQFLSQEKEPQAKIYHRIHNRSNQKLNSHDIAIIGMAGRFPGANNVEEFWQNLCQGKDSITFFNDEDLDPSIDRELINNPQYVKAKGIMDQADHFDASFFNINPLEAQVMDPQQRIFLEIAYHALENAGYSPQKYQGLIGLFAGAGYNTYLLTNLMKNPDIINRFGEFKTMLVNDKDYLPTKVSYKLNLKGISVNINTACSTSLVTVIHAVNSLRNYECDMALAGGISLTTPLKSGYLYQEGGILSPDGVCRPFDLNAQGTTFNNGGAIVVLKRLEEALKDGDRIIAVIKGVGINNDGGNKVSFTAPSVEGQAEAIMMACADAKINPETISYIEAHGTATPLGDPIEIAALTKAFRQQTQKKQYCAIGSVKSNVGHLLAAAGVTGLIKTALALKYQQIPASLHFTSPNPALDLSNTPFYVNDHLTPWVRQDQLLRAGVSSFGVGGTNAHVILEEAPPLAPSPSLRPQQVLFLSAKTQTALEQITHNLAQYLRQNSDVSLADVAYTLQVGREDHPYRRFVVCGDTPEAIDHLETLPPLKTATKVYQEKTRELIFMFPGQGSQYVNMGLNLYQTEPLFKEIIDYCSERLKPDLGDDLRHFLYPPTEDHEKASLALQETRITQPAIFTLEYALAQLWISWGIQPHGVIGHSIGEFVAATLAGVFTLENALKLVALRGKLMQEQPRGSMLSVKAESSQVQQWLDCELSEEDRKQCAIATINSPSLCVVSGVTEIIEEFKNKLEKKEVICKLLHTSHAFHSPMMEPILKPFGEVMEQIPLSAPNFPIMSTVTGTWLTEQQAQDPQYWTNHLRATVRFAEGIKTLWHQSDRILLEVGPRTTTTTLARQQITHPKTQVAIASLGSSAENDQEWVSLLQAIAQLWLTGKNLDFEKFYALEKRQRVALPPYPFERKPHWVEPLSVSSYQLPVTTEQLSVKESQSIFNGEISPNHDLIHQENNVNILCTLDTETMNHNQAIVSQQLEIMAQQLQLLESDDFP